MASNSFGDNVIWNTSPRPRGPSIREPYPATGTFITIMQHVAEVFSKSILFTPKPVTFVMSGFHRTGLKPTATQRAPRHLPAVSKNC